MDISVRDLVILDIAGTAADAYGALLGPTADRYTLGAVDVAIGAPEWCTGHGILVAADDVEAGAKLANRRGLEVTPVADGFAGTVDGMTLGLTGPRDLCVGSATEIVGVDHIVLTSPNRDRLIATLSGRLGFDLRLDRIQSWGVHQLFFRRENLLVEAVLSEGDGVDPAGPDALWGIAWRTTDADETHRRLTDKGVVVSEIRRGAKPGTRVATIKDPALGVPTIVLEQS